MQENSFEKFLTANSGTQNAFTTASRLVNLSWVAGSDLNEELSTKTHFYLISLGRCSAKESATTYFFDVKPGAFLESLRRFSSFFKEPLFTESATEREVSAIESEFAKNRESDAK